MQRQQLQIYTQDHRYHGVNSKEVLQQFIKYQSICQDPLNIFRYMEERAICTFMPAFWLAKAELLAELGDYTGCFQCVDLASSSIDEDQVQTLLDLVNGKNNLLKKLVDDMRQFPLKTKRTVAEFNLHIDSDSGKSSKFKIAEKIKIYEEKYKILRGQKQKATLMKWQKLPRSWLFEKYLKEDEAQKMIEQKIHQNSVRLSKQVKYHSMHTPIRVKDPQRLTKTMDSVQILKKKRSTRQKSRKHGNIQNSQSDIQNHLDSSREERMMNSLPVGQKFNIVKRRVTFRAQNTKIQKIRKAEPEPPSFGKIVPQSSNNSDDMKMEEEVFSQENVLSEPYSKE